MGTYDVTVAYRELHYGRLRVQADSAGAARDKAEQQVDGVSDMDVLGDPDVEVEAISAEPVQEDGVRHEESVTIDGLIRALQDAREKSRLGGNTVVCVCRLEQSYESARWSTLRSDDDGAVFLISADPA